MFRILLLAGVFACLLSPAEARQRHTSGLDPMCNITMPCVTPYASSPQKVRDTRGRYIGHEMGIGGPRAVRVPKARETVSEGRPAGCPHAWCGCWLAAHRGISDRSLWLARNWASVGHPLSGPQVGAIAVWRHHVGQINAVDGNRILLLSGNDGHAVRERWRPIRGIIAYRGI